MAAFLEEENMADKIKKAPGIFKKPIKKNKWEKKYLKKLYLPEDQKFLKSLAVEEDDKIRIKADGLSKKDLKRLKALGKTIKSNRKSLNFILIFILVIIAGGGIFFELYLKDKLVQDFIERQLENIFLARVDADGVDLSILKGELSLDYLAVANTDSPMRNLFECSSVKAELKTAELLQGRVYIESLGFEGLVRNTEREESGALTADERETPAAESSGDAAAAAEDIKSGALADVVNQLGAVAGNIDVEALLEAQKKNLKSFQVIEDSKQKVEGYTETWKGKASDWEQEIAGWKTSVDYVKSVNPDSFTSLDSAQATITRLEGIYKDAENDYNSVQTDIAAVERQYAEVSSMYEDVRAAVDADYKYVESLVSIPEGSKADWVASILEEQLSLPAGKYLSYLDRGLEWYNRFKRLKEQREQSSPAERRPGRKLPPPADAPPSFVLEHAFASGSEPDVVYSFDLFNLVSEPEIWPDKTRLEIGLDMPSTGPAEALITEDALEVEILAAPFDFGDQLKVVDIAALDGSLYLKSNISWNDAGFSGSLSTVSDNVNLEPADSESLVFRLINTSFESVKPFEAAGDFFYGKDGSLDFSIDTEMDNRLSNAASDLLKEGADEGLQMLKDYLEKELEGPLAEYGTSQEELKEYADRIKNYEQEIAGYRIMADEKIAEIEQSVKDNIARQAEQLIKDAVPADIVPEGADKAVEDAADSLKNTFGSKLKF